MPDLVQYAIRFALGGCLVALFSTFGEVLRPKGFAGLFAAAPSIALGSLALTIQEHGSRYAATEARAMLCGAVALIAYAALCTYLMGVRRIRAAPAAIWALLAWAAIASGGLWLGSSCAWF